MKLFERYEELHEIYPEDCDTIWNFLNEHGKVYFDRRSLESLWREFSDYIASAGFLEPEEHYLNSFMDWLEDYKCY